MSYVCAAKEITELVIVMQPMNMFRFGPQALQNPQVSAVPGTSVVQLGGGILTDSASSGKISK